MAENFIETITENYAHKQEPPQNPMCHSTKRQYKHLKYLCQKGVADKRGKKSNRPYIQT